MFSVARMDSYNLTRINQRWVSSQPSKAVVITGGRSQMVPKIAQEALNRNYNVFCCTRTEPTKIKLPLSWEKISDQELSQVESWKNIFNKIKNEKIFLINTIGTAIFPKGKTLESINELPILAAVEAFNTVRNRKTIGHISSIAATYFPEDVRLQKKWDSFGIEYCVGRKRVDSILKNSGIPTTILRPGFVFNDMETIEKAIISTRGILIHLSNSLSS